MMDYGPNSALVRQLLGQIRAMTMDDVADLYASHGARFVASGYEAQRAATARATRAAERSLRLPEYLRARRDAALEWRGVSPAGQGPWLLVRQAITNAAGALVVSELLDERSLLLLLGPWRQTMGSLVPVGPGTNAPVRREAARLR